MADEAGVRAAARVVRLTTAAFGFKSTALRSVATGLDWTFRAVTEDGRVVAVRVGDPATGQTLPRVASEMAWLEALWSESDLRVPRPVRTLAGDLAAAARLGSIEVGVTVVEWLDGRRRRAKVSKAEAEAIGRIAGALHEHGARWARPSWFDRKTWTPELMSGAQRPGDVLLDSLLGAGRARELRTLDAKVAEIDEEFRRQPKAAGLVHGDVHPGNVLWHGVEPRVIDLNDSGFCLHAFDLARTLRTLRWRPSGDDLVATCTSGYRAVRGHLPVGWDEHAAALEAAADLAALRYYAQLVPSRGPRMADVIEATAVRIERWLERDG